jgi:hypothetical protein
MLNIFMNTNWTPLKKMNFRFRMVAHPPMLTFVCRFVHNFGEIVKITNFQKILRLIQMFTEISSISADVPNGYYDRRQCTTYVESFLLIFDLTTFCCYQLNRQHYVHSSLPPAFSTTNEPF